jgi:methionyl-tRNA formyltransferase
VIEKLSLFWVIHPSLVPKYRGGAPIIHALMRGEKETGVSIIKISTGKFDAGDVLMQRRI